jgi:glycosyltransferase involved in cell wall biosynthesis
MGYYVGPNTGRKSTVSAGVKKVLLTVHKFFPEHRAGTEVLTLKVAQELQRRGYEVLVVTANPPDLDASHRAASKVKSETTDFVHDGVPVHVIEEPLRLKDYEFSFEFNHPHIAQHFDGILEKFAPDVVHIFHAQNLSASIIDKTIERNIPVVASTTDFWFVCPMVQLTRQDGAVCRGPKSKGANCLTCYTPKLFPPVSEFKEAVLQKYPAIKKFIPKSMEEISFSSLYALYLSGKALPAGISTCERSGALVEAANKLQAIMVPTKLMADIFAENGIDEKRVHLVPFGIDTKLLTPYQQKTESDVVRVGYIGTIFEHKGVDLLVDAFQALPADVRASLTIYGDLNQFPEYGKVVEEKAKNGPNKDKITLAGTFPNAELGPVLSNIDVLVVASRWYENTPLVIQSALATRTPLIATDLGGMSELIKHEHNGLLFELNNVHALKDSLSSVISNPAKLKTFRDNIAPERTVADMVDDIERIYGQALASTKSQNSKYAIVTN